MLEEVFGVSRITVRRAIGDMVADGWYNARLAPGLLERSVHKSVYSILASQFDVPIDEAEQVCTAAAATADIGRALGIDVGQPVLRIRRLSSSRGRPVEVCTSTYRPDRYTLRMRLRDGREQRHARAEP